MSYEPKPISTSKIVVRAGKDAYHFAQLRNKFTEKEILDAFYEDIKKEKPDLPCTQAMSLASSEIECIDRQARGNGRCKRIHDNLKEQTSNHPWRNTSRGRG